MIDAAATITALTGLAGAAGVACRFVWNKIERRFETIDAELDKCRERETASQKRSGVYVTVIELLWVEIKRLHPGTEPPTLARATKLLNSIKGAPIE